MRTLTATGATSSTRRNINAATAGGLAGLGAILGISAAYLALAAGRISNLTPLPTTGPGDHRRRNAIGGRRRRLAGGRPRAGGVGPAPDRLSTTLISSAYRQPAW